MGSGFVVLWLVFLIFFGYACWLFFCNSFLQLAQCKSHLARFFPDTHTRSNYPNTPSPVHPGHILRSVPTVLGRNNIRNAQQRMSSTLQRFECFPLEKDAHAKFSEIYAQFLLRNLLLTKRFHSTWWISSQAHFKSCGISSALLYHTLCPARTGSLL